MCTYQTPRTPLSNSSFVTLLRGFRTSGGIALGNVLGRLFEDHHRGDYISWPGMLVNGKMFAFARRQRLWIPMFQLHRGNPSIETAAQKGREKLAATADAWSLGSCFPGPNDQLSCQRPADLLDRRLLAIKGAARSCPVRNPMRRWIDRAARAPVPT